MADSVIQNVRKNSDGDILDVGVKGRWDWTVAEVVASIETGSNTFFVNCPQRADVVVSKTAAGHQFL
jgi:hypothetical protein